MDTSESDDPDLLTRLAMLPANTRSQMVDPDTLLSWFPNVQLLSLGSVELQAFSKSIQCISPTSFTLVFDGNETLLSHIFGGTSSTHALSRLRRRLRHLHVIGINPQSELTGLPMPLTILEPLCAGSFTAGSCFDARALSAQATNADRTAPGVRHLRYDTRKFSFRPLDIFATRLRYFFQRVDVPQPSEAAARVLENLGLGLMDCLEICWRKDVAQNAREKINLERQRDILRTSMYTGGWPQELRGAWTDRGIWRGNAEEAFRLELKDAISELYGWDDEPVHAYLDGAYVDRIRAGFSERENTVIHRLSELLAPAYATDGQPVDVRLQVRRPGTFLRVGEEQAALYVSERVALFSEQACKDPSV
ncbi:hypothetical protein MNAN1_003519 [Malassezia nana]|uniref:Uncharacterized protein n=1 Tax=Malassezia nana TaxID=180528 RepID=A0AAF0J3Y8_9BASI|nr:hypothetical protein MNAN1_003519 [Malassezia nana]